jgi:hypothetical protein
LEGLGKEVEWGSPLSLGGESQLGSISFPAETSGGGSAIPGACSRRGWRVAAIGAPVRFLSLPAFSSSSAVKRQAESPQVLVSSPLRVRLKEDSWWESAI